jgi:hypothetical protein
MGIKWGFNGFKGICVCFDGSDFLLFKEIHPRVHRRGLKYHHISCRIKRMNKRMQNEIGERVADKVGWKWMLSNFMYRNWSAKKSEIEA